MVRKRNKRLKGSHSVSDSKHQQGVDSLVERLYNESYVNKISANQDYNLGELDVHTSQGDYNRGVYYEYKTNHTRNGLTKALSQGQRWTKYEHNRHQNKNFYCVYVTSNYKPIIIAKNGSPRVKLSDYF